MLNRRLARLAFRTRASGLVVATTGSATLSATSTGYARSSGSFVTDGFLVGQDITPTGFTQTAPGVITKVEALALTIDGGRTVQTAGAARSLVSGLPTMRAWQNTVFVPIDRRPYVVEALPLGGSNIKTWPGKIGRFEQDGISAWTWYVPLGMGTGAIDAGVTALMARFAPYTILALSDGSVITMRGDVGPSAGDVIQEEGWARCTVRLPWQVSTRNAVLA